MPPEVITQSVLATTMSGDRAKRSPALSAQEITDLRPVLDVDHGRKDMAA
jgi:hypothetical protein